MNPPVKLRGALFAPVLCLLAAAVLALPPRERTLFREIPPNDPVREVIAAVLGSRRCSLRDRFTAREWSTDGYGAAWERAKGYFPGKTFLVRPGTYFMTHGFDADGRLFMEIHESPYLALCVDNRRTFAPGAVVEEYRRMLAAANGGEAAGFAEKTGRLAASFRDEESHRRLRRALGGSLYLRLVEALRDEDYHMLAGGLIHEGTHAGLDDALVARLQREFKAGSRPVQWDELRAFMAELGYHARSCAPASADIEASWEQVGSLLKSLESFRKTPRLPAGNAKERFDRIAAQAGAQAALIRLRAREIWQSARRMQDLAEGFEKDYVKGTPPPDVGELLAGVGGGAAAFTQAAGGAIQATELAVRSLEAVLETWDAWAAGRRSFPPPVTDSQAIMTRAKGIIWPAPAAGPAAALMKKAAAALDAERASL